MFKTNQNKSVRILQTLIALLLLFVPLNLDQGCYPYVLYSVGSMLLFNGVSETCATEIVWAQHPYIILLKSIVE